MPDGLGTKASVAGPAKKARGRHPARRQGSGQRPDQLRRRPGFLQLLHLHRSLLRGQAVRRDQAAHADVRLRDDADDGRSRRPVGLLVGAAHPGSAEAVARQASRVLRTGLERLAARHAVEDLRPVRARGATVVQGPHGGHARWRLLGQALQLPQARDQHRAGLHERR